MAPIDIPTFEPEIYAAKLKKHKGDKDKLATTGLKSMCVGGVSILSRYQKAREFEVLREIVGDMEAEMRGHIRFVSCDSKASWVVEAELKQWNMAVAEDVAQWLAQGLRQLIGGYNGIQVTCGSDVISIDPDWETE